MQHLLWEVLQNAPVFGLILFSIIDTKMNHLTVLCFILFLFPVNVCFELG